MITLRITPPQRAAAALGVLVVAFFGSQLLAHPFGGIDVVLLAIAISPLVDSRFWPMRAIAPAALMLLGVRVLWGTTWGTALDGAIQGMLVALLALGLAIVYRANRIVNFAAADLGQVPALLALLLFTALGWNIYLTAGIGLVSAVVLGVLVEFLFLRRFFKAPRLILTVATIGVAQILVALGLLLPQWIGGGNTAEYPPFIDATFTVGRGLQGTIFDGSDVMVLLVVPLLLLGLVLFFRFTSIGIALRATAENADRASLLGIPVRRLQSVVWALAAVLAFVAMFLRIGVSGASLGVVLDPTLLLSALGAAVIGRMERFPTVVASAVGLGIVSSAVRYHFSSDAYRPAIIAAIIAVALLVQRSDQLTRLGSAATSTWQATREVRAIPAELRHLREVRLARRALSALVLLGIVLIPALLPEDRVKLCATIGIYAIIGISLVVLTGWAGQVSLGQMAFVGVSGAVAGTLATRWHWDIAWILLVSGVVGALTTIVVGMPTLRARGLAFAVMTLAFALATSNYLLNTGYSPVQSWVPKDHVPRTHVFGFISVNSDTRYYVLVVATLAFTIVAVRGLRSSRTGRVLIGVRDNERAAQSYSIGARSTLLLAFAVSGFVAGMAGGLFVLQQQALDHGAFAPTEGLRIFAMVVVGGLGSISGAVLGAMFVYGAKWFLPQEYSLLATGAGLLLVLLLVPGGLGAAAGDLRDAILRWWAARKGIRVPSLLADTRVVEVKITPEMADAMREALDRPEVQELAELHE